jgi:hypothetical protein
MKKLFFAALIATTVATSAFASDANKINFRISESFKHEYNNATNVNWTLRPTFAKASFEVDGKKVEAFYNLEGKMIGTSKSISIDELPVGSKRSFAKKYAGYTVQEAIKFDGEDDTAYYISAENSEQSLILRVEEAGGLSIFKRTKK